MNAMRFIMLRWLCVLSTFICCARVSEAASSRPYWLDISGKDETTQFKLRKRGTGQIVWTRTVGSRDSIQWATSGRAVAIFYRIGTPADNKVLVWREGFLPWTRSIKVDYDSVMNAVWSPDDRRILFRVGGSGDGTLDLGGLYCLNASNKKLYPVSSVVRNMKWVSERKVFYWTATDVDFGDYSAYVVNKNPSAWYSPA